MQTLSTNDARCIFGPLVDLASAAPAADARQGGPVIAAMEIEEHDHLRDAEVGLLDASKSTDGARSWLSRMLKMEFNNSPRIATYYSGSNLDCNELYLMCYLFSNNRYVL